MVPNRCHYYHSPRPSLISADTQEHGMNPEVRPAGGATVRAHSADRGPASGASAERTALLLILGLTLLGLVLRFWHLGDWNFQATEMFTFRDSQRPQFGNARPLGYLLNYFVVLPFVPLNELGLPLLPVPAGTLAILVIFLFGLRVVAYRAALFEALVVPLNPTQVLYS